LYVSLDFILWQRHSEGVAYSIVQVLRVWYSNVQLKILQIVLLLVASGFAQAVFRSSQFSAKGLFDRPSSFSVFADLLV